MNNFYDLKKAIPAERKEISLECPACHETLKAVALDGIVQGYCANTRTEVYLKVD